MEVAYDDLYIFLLCNFSRKIRLRLNTVNIVCFSFCFLHFIMNLLLLSLCMVPVMYFKMRLSSNYGTS